MAIKKLQDIYKDIKNGFSKRTGINLTEGTVIDSYVLAASEGIEEAYKEIEANKNPHIFTKLEGDNIDKMAMLLNCPRFPNESDESYLYRVMNWTLINQSSNSTAIESALSNLSKSSNATYVPYTSGVGTATVFLIPNSYSTKDDLDASIHEAKERLSRVVSPDSYITYEISKALPIEIFSQISFLKNSDEKHIKDNIEKAIKDHINKIAIGDLLSYGELNRIGMQQKGVDFFSITHILVDGELMRELNEVQTIESKFLFGGINWTVAV